jgi:hypothetical protein
VVSVTRMVMDPSAIWTNMTSNDGVGRGMGRI